MEPQDIADALEKARRSLKKVESLYFSSPQSIRDGSLERALLELARSLKVVEEAMEAQRVIRRPFTGLSTEAELLSGLATALRLRMIQVGRINVSGVGDFLRRVEDLLRRAREELGLTQSDEQ
ncbi:MAG: hypothetical protein ACP5FT_02015 [Acidilobus sp.]